MANGEAHLELVGKTNANRIALCAHARRPRARIAGHIHDHLAFQEIRLEVVVKDTAG